MGWILEKVVNRLQTLTFFQQCETKTCENLRAIVADGKFYDRLPTTGEKLGFSSRGRDEDAAGSTVSDVPDTELTCPLQARL